MTKEERKRWRQVADLVIQIETSIAALDAEMKMPPSLDRGKRIAAIVNPLEFRKDAVKHFTLGMQLGAPAASQLRKRNPKPATP